jgi:hypothetical protein
MHDRWDTSLHVATAFLLTTSVFRKIKQSVAFQYRGGGASGCVAVVRGGHWLKTQPSIAYECSKVRTRMRADRSHSAEREAEHFHA